MATGKRKESPGAAVPLISIAETAAEKESFRLSWTVLASLHDYVAYVRDATGHETSPDEVINRGMQRLFEADRGFRQWLQRKNNDGRQAAKPKRAERHADEPKASATGKPDGTSQPGSGPRQ